MGTVRTGGYVLRFVAGRGCGKPSRIAISARTGTEGYGRNHLRSFGSRLVVAGFLFPELLQLLERILVLRIEAQGLLVVLDRQLLFAGLHVSLAQAVKRVGR